MKKKPIYLLCAACLAWSCTNDPTADPAGLAGTSSGELVPVSLELRMTDFAAPPTRATQNIRATAPGGGTALVDAEISAPQPASRTRTGGSGEFTIPDDQKVFRLDILQFNGTGTQAQLVKKAAYISEDGDYTRYEFSGLELVDSGKEKNRIVILGNADPALAGKLQEKTSGTEGTKYESLLQERISRTGETDTSFPLVPRNQTDLLGHGRHDRHLGVADRCRTHAQCGQGEFQLFPDRAHAEGLRRVGHRAEHHPARVILHPAGIRSAFPRTADNRSLLQQGAGRGRRIPGKCGHSPAGARRGEPLPARQPAVQRSRDGGLDPLPERPGLRHKPATAGEKDRRQFDNPDRRLHDSPGGQLHRRLQHPPQQRDQLPDHAGQRQPGRLQRGQIHCREIRREIRKIPEPRRQFRMLGLHG